MGVVVDLGAHGFPPATISDEGGAMSGLVSPFQGTLGPSSCFQVPLYGPHVESTQMNLFSCGCP